ncbi:MAG TPA: cytochrome C [Burkholderiales bacterium]|nr:cytochrome C [Burkholderiales bacterium]
MNRRIFALTAALGLASGLDAPGAQAIPAFARQTGQNCNACHVSFPELTPYGRYFKLSGYTLGKPISAYPEDIPIAVMAVVGASDTKNNTYSDGSQVDPYNGKFKAQQLSLFLGGKATDHLGAFMQWTAAPNPDTGGYDFGADNADIRLVNTSVAPGGQEPDLIYGLTLNNNPTVQDVWNTAPAWGFPYMASGTSITGPAVSTLIDGGLAGTAGIGGYAYWKQSIYAEFSAYRSADGLFSFLNAGNDHLYLQGYTPYWRFAYEKDWGANSFEVGTFGMIADQYVDPTVPSGPTNRFKDYALDSQFQHITDVNTWTAQATYIHEIQDYDASTGNNASDTLNTFRVKGSYWYQHKYGASLGYFTTTGSADDNLYSASSFNSKPDSAGYVAEVDYMPWDYFRVGLQYNAYSKYYGGSSYIDPAGGARNANDNNSTFLYVWMAY